MLRDVEFAMGLTVEAHPRAGQRFVLAVRPPEWYAGKVGAGAVVQGVSDTGIYVLFDGGLRESFPPRTFAEHFKPNDPRAPQTPRSTAKVNGPGIERTPSGRIVLHR